VDLEADRSPVVLKLGAPVVCSPPGIPQGSYCPLGLFAASSEAMRLCSTPLFRELLCVKDSDGFVRPCCVMADAGPSLNDLMTNFRNSGLPPPLFRHLAVQILDELRTLHRQGLIHRDIKPANICVEGAPRGHGLFAMTWQTSLPQLRAVLIDYDFAYPSGEEPSLFLGTPDYASREQLLSHRLGPRDDLEALGYTLVSLFVGKRQWSVTEEITQDEHGWTYERVSGEIT
jgi:serine/threonine protein kinase